MESCLTSCFLLWKRCLRYSLKFSLILYKFECFNSKQSFFVCQPELSFQQFMDIDIKRLGKLIISHLIGILLNMDQSLFIGQ